MNITWSEDKFDAELSLDEGRRLVPYLDEFGIETVGVGHNLIAGPLPGQTYPMTNAQVDALLLSDIASSVQKLDTYLPWWRTLSDARQRVMLNMVFNMGIGRPGQGSGLLGFTTFLNLVRTGNYAAAATDMLHTLWARQVGTRAKRLSVMMSAG